MTRTLLALAMLAALFLTACSNGVGSGPGGETTCREWLKLDDEISVEDRLYHNKENKKQQDILKRMLSAHGKDTGESNRISAEYSVIMFCFPDGTGSRPNINQPIEDAIDW